MSKSIENLLINLLLTFSYGDIKHIKLYDFNTTYFFTQ